MERKQYSKNTKNTEHIKQTAQNTKQGNKHKTNN